MSHPRPCDMRTALCYCSARRPCLSGSGERDEPMVATLFGRVVAVSMLAVSALLVVPEAPAGAAVPAAGLRNRDRG